MLRKRRKKAFSDKVVLITGGTSGIGKATAIRFAKSGAQVIICGRHQRKYLDAIEEFKQAKVNGRIRYIKVDVRSEAEVKFLLEKIEEDYRKLDFAVNCAGVVPAAPAPIEDTNLDLKIEEGKENAMQTDLIGTFYSVKHEIKLMKQDSTTPKAIVNISSVNAYIAAPGGCLYSIAKSGVLGMTSTAGVENGTANIRVNAVAPGPVDTPLLRNQKPKKMSMEHFLTKVCTAGIPMERIAQPEEIANSILYLCSERASYINGTIITIDGSLLAQG